MKNAITVPKTAAEYAALDKRAGELVGCCENSEEGAELEAIADALGAYDSVQRLTPSEIASLRTDFQVAGRKMAAHLADKAAKTK